MIDLYFKIITVAEKVILEVTFCDQITLRSIINDNKMSSFESDNGFKIFDKISQIDDSKISMEQPVVKQGPIRNSMPHKLEDLSDIGRAPHTCVTLHWTHPGPWVST